MSISDETYTLVPKVIDNTRERFQIPAGIIDQVRTPDAHVMEPDVRSVLVVLHVHAETNACITVSLYI